MTKRDGRKKKRKDPVLDLPFVRDNKRPFKPGQNPRDFWAIDPPADPFDQELYGMRLAVDFLAFEHERRTNEGGTPLPSSFLPWVISAMPKEHGFVERGFLSVIGKLAAAYADKTCRIEVANWIDDFGETVRKRWGTE